MPPRWPRKPDRNDPSFRRLDDRMNFAVHVAIFLAINSGLWFFHNLNRAEWPWLTPLSAIWLGVLLMHLLYIAFIADYSPSTSKS
ncbi:MULTISPECIES: 2TM domain-containing protein [unclassified Synechocystis]|uniref:2TM domain-containing protein n=1 Tax=unclassified Synechocystis TaxID=2640012 RepID=UPI000414A082|nr:MULTISPECIES: 2TM domain-containing protein [unclassified Synechocystis]AIE72778.1 hypothetical protein D082_02490 [Synechocystis sp. PCC 6714]MCT0254582.1 2TM domain-containing protein [Synechocystis sp. CS-94]